MAGKAPPAEAEVETDSQRNERLSHESGSRIVSATGTAVGRFAQGTKSAVTERIEAAMVRAVEQAAEDGVTDPDEVKALKIAAHKAVMTDLEAESRAALDAE